MGDLKSVVVLTVSSRGGASTRVRMIPVIDALRTESVKVTHVSAASRLWWVRVLFILSSRRSSLVVQKLTPPVLWTFLATLLSHKTVVDIDDAIYLGYPNHRPQRRSMVRVFFLAKRADRVVVSSPIIMSDLPPEISEKIVVFPGPAPSVLEYRRSERHGIVWLGSPSTFGAFKRLIGPALSKVSGRLPLIAVGSPVNRRSNFMLEQTWTVERQEEALLGCRIGLAPISESEWDRRKVSYKILEYISHAVLPVTERNDPAVSLLGDLLEELCVVVPGKDSEAWRRAMDEAYGRSLDQSWYEAREKLFERLSAASFVGVFRSSI